MEAITITCAKEKRLPKWYEYISEAKGGVPKGCSAYSYELQQRHRRLGQNYSRKLNDRRMRDAIDAAFLRVLESQGVKTETAREKEFDALARRWKRETARYGHLSKIVMHEDYQRIMTMGKPSIRILLRDLEKGPAHWFWALHNLVPSGQDPAEGLTTIEEARQAWLQWGRENNYL